MVPLIITPDVVDDVRRVMAHASLAENYRRSDVVPGDDPRHVLLVPAGFCVVFSVQELNPGQLLRHLSVSVSATQGRTVPSRATMQVLADLFGFSTQAEMGILDVDGPSVIHVLEVVKEVAETVPAT